MISVSTTTMGRDPVQPERRIGVAATGLGAPPQPSGEHQHLGRVDAPAAGGLGDQGDDLGVEAAVILRCARLQPLVEIGGDVFYGDVGGHANYRKSTLKWKEFTLKKLMRNRRFGSQMSVGGCR